MFNISLLGNSNVGKTSLMLRYCDDIYRDNQTTSSVGVDCKSKTIKINNSNVKLQLWDTAGMEKFGQLLPQRYFLCSFK